MFAMTWNDAWAAVKAKWTPEEIEEGLMDIENMTLEQARKMAQGGAIGFQEGAERNMRLDRVSASAEREARRWAIERVLDRKPADDFVRVIALADHIAEYVLRGTKPTDKPMA